MPLAPVLPFVHPVLKTAFPHCLWTGNIHSGEIALTFDDGPHPQYTLELLEVLDRYQIRASFFWLGWCVERYPDVAKAVYDRGHWIALHGYDHRSFPKLSLVELKDSLEKTQDAIYKVCQLSPELVRDVRPPNGLFTPKTLTALKQWNYRPVMWSVVPVDWVSPGVDLVVNRVLKQTQNGSIIVLHDGYSGGKDVAQSVNQLLPKLLQYNYKFVEIDKFWQG